MIALSLFYAVGHVANDAMVRGIPLYDLAGDSLGFLPPTSIGMEAFIGPHKVQY